MLETERLTIRRFETQDAENFCELIRDKMSSPVSAYDDQFPTDDKGVKVVFDYFMQEDAFMAVLLKKSNLLIGYIALNDVDNDVRNIGYCLHTAYWGKGYATEAIGAVIEYARDVLCLRKLISGTAVGNATSVKLLEKFNFREVSRRECSFACDKDGNPISFIGCSYELVL